MRSSPESLAMAKSFEGCSLTSYPDGGFSPEGFPVGSWTIGWGHTRGVIQGMTITQDEADQFFIDDWTEIEGIVLRLILHPEMLSNNQIGALTDFTFNIGTGELGIKDGFAVLKNGGPSTLLKLINSLDFTDAANEFTKWVKVAGRPNAGLLKRRNAERALFSTPDGSPVHFP